jgi:transcriptional regulator with XRE-family HTH domain
MAHMIRLTDPTQLSGAVRFLRGIAGLTQRQVAAEGHFQQTQITWWETDKRRPNLASLIRLANILGYDVALIPRREDT